MTDETAEKLPDQLDKLRLAIMRADDDEIWLKLADYLEQTHAELVGRLEHVDDNTHRLLQLVSGLVAELNSWRPLLDLFKPNGSRPDFISAAQGMRAAKQARRGNGGDQRAGAPRGSRARGSIAGR